MRHKNILWLLMTTVLLFLGCFKDKGSYEYIQIDSPQWLFDIHSGHIGATGRSGGKIEFKASDKFFWLDKTRADDVRYEWRYNDIVISTEIDFEIDVDEFVIKAGIKNYASSSEGINGKFIIIEKKSGITHMCRVYTTLSARYVNYDWIVLSENGNNSKCSMIAKKKKIVDNASVSYFDLDDNVYETINGASIPGKPIGLHLAKARNIGPIGSATIMTDKVCYELDLSTLQLSRELKDDFPDGVPADFTIIDRDDCDYDTGANTFLINSKGEMFTRQMTANYLGGKFLSEPYIVDAKGSKITKFGHHLFSSPNTPCWDEKNNRVLMANRWGESFPGPSGMPWDNITIYRSRVLPVVPKTSVTQKGLPVWNMPAGTKLLHLSQFSHGGNLGSYTNTGYTMIYNTADGKTMIGDFIVDGGTLNVLDEGPATNFNIEFPGGKMDEKTIFLTSGIQRGSATATERFRTLFTQGGKVMYMERPISNQYLLTPLTVGTMFTFDSNVSLLTYDWYDCKLLVIGCENGDIFFYDINQPSNPKLTYSFNVGGKVIAVKQLGNQSSSMDYY